MKRFLHFIFSSAILFGTSFTMSADDTAADAENPSEELNVINVYDGAVFYDGYLMEKNPDKELQDGILRHSCSLYSIPLTDEQLDKIGEQLKLHVDVEALCDNYDRIGNVNIAFVPKGEQSYDPAKVSRMEIGRFITPFMNKNKEPNTVPYEYDIEYLSPMFRDKSLRERYDFWMELEIFGVPYAANQQIKGCKDRNDVFKGFVRFETSEPAPATDDTLVLPLVIKKPEYIGANLNNYKEEATDTLGKTTKTYHFEIPGDIDNARVVLITSNHGANVEGEEYRRRDHYVYLDDALVLQYKPGRESCEPFRKYNTQANGIYGWSAMSDEAWQEFSNWCPGDVIDNRQILLGDFSKGKHKIRISVPKARFASQQGDIPVSMYIIGHVTDPAGVNTVETESPVNVSANGGMLHFSAAKEIMHAEIYNLAGACLYSMASDEPVNVSAYEKGVYLVNLLLSDGVAYTVKVSL